MSEEPGLELEAVFARFQGRGLKPLERRVTFTCQSLSEIDTAVKKIRPPETGFVLSRVSPKGKTRILWTPAGLVPGAEGPEHAPYPDEKATLEASEVK